MLCFTFFITQKWNQNFSSKTSQTALEFIFNFFIINYDDDKAKNLADERNIFNNSVYDIELKVSIKKFFFFFFF